MNYLQLSIPLPTSFLPYWGKKFAMSEISCCFATILTFSKHLITLPNCLFIAQDNLSRNCLWFKWDKERITHLVAFHKKVLPETTDWLIIPLNLPTMYYFFHWPIILHTYISQFICIIGKEHFYQNSLCAMGSSPQYRISWYFTAFNVFPYQISCENVLFKRIIRKIFFSGLLKIFFKGITDQFETAFKRSPGENTIFVTLDNVVPVFGVFEAPLSFYGIIFN